MPWKMKYEMIYFGKHLCNLLSWLRWFTGILSRWLTSGVLTTNEKVGTETAVVPHSVETRFTNRQGLSGWNAYFGSLFATFFYHIRRYSCFDDKKQPHQRERLNCYTANSKTLEKEAKTTVTRKSSVIGGTLDNSSTRPSATPETLKEIPASRIAGWNISSDTSCTFILWSIILQDQFSVSASPFAALRKSQSHILNVLLVRSDHGSNEIDPLPVHVESWWSKKHLYRVFFRVCSRPDGITTQMNRSCLCSFLLWFCSTLQQPLLLLKGAHLMACVQLVSYIWNNCQEHRPQHCVGCIWFEMCIMFLFFCSMLLTSGFGPAPVLDWLIGHLCCCFSFPWSFHFSLGTGESAFWKRGFPTGQDEPGYCPRRSALFSVTITNPDFFSVTLFRRGFYFIIEKEKLLPVTIA